MKKSRSVSLVLRSCEKYGDDVKKQKRELKRFLAEGRKNSDLPMMGAAYCRLAGICEETDDLRGMLVNSLKAVTVLKNTEEYGLLTRAYFVLSQAYLGQGNIQMSLVCDEQAYDVVKRHRIKGELRIAALNNLSVGYHAMEQPKKSIKCLNECIELLKKDFPEEHTDLFMYSINLAGCHKDLGEYDRADEILGSVGDLTDKVGYEPLVCDYYVGRAIVSYLRGDGEAGDRYTDTALSVFPENVYPLPLYDDLCEIARMITKRKDRARSKKIFDIMTVYAENNPGTLEQLFAIRMIANYYKDFGNYKLAAEYFSKYEELNDKQMRELRETEMKLHETMRTTDDQIRRLERKMRESEELLFREPLTKLMNRRALLRVSSEFIDSAASRRQKVGAIFIDIDYFKECNDTYGHTTGDGILTTVAGVCRELETKNVRFARYGGDEFFGITKGLTDDEVRDVARQICRAVRRAAIPNEKNPNGGKLTLSAGLVNVAITEDTDTILEIANYADKALYYAKNAGRNAIYELRYVSDGTKSAGAEFVKIEF